jgi:hypothetical protein
MIGTFSPAGLGAQRTRASLCRACTCQVLELMDEPDCTCFMDYVETLCDLMKPFAEAVYEIEADRLLLSACYPMTLQLHEQTENWVPK